MTALIDSLAEEIGPLNKNILKPTIHLNGTSAEELSNQVNKAYSSGQDTIRR